MRKLNHQTLSGFCRALAALFVFAVWFSMAFEARAFNLNISAIGKPGNGPIGSFRWLIEEDTTFPVIPGVSNPASLSFSFHRSYAPVVMKGNSSNTAVTLPDGKRYFISVLPDTGYTIGGASIADGQTTVTVACNQLPLPTAQISVLVFEDNYPINNAPENTEPGLMGFKIIIIDAGGRYGISGGQMMLDAFGNMIGTTYQKNPDGSFVMVDGAPVVEMMGMGYVMTDITGKALIKYLHPGKLSVKVLPPDGQGWQQTTTIEGTPITDAWVKANEPPYFTEFGPAGYHVFTGFVKQMNRIPVQAGGSTISGQVVNLRMSRPPAVQFNPGDPLSNCWVGLNAGANGVGLGLFAAPCNPSTGEFSIPDVPPGSYQLVFWDKYLDNIFAFLGVNVPPGGAPIQMGKIPVFRWFGTLESRVFYDANENGFRDMDEMYMLPEQAVNLRFRDGTVYASQTTDQMGETAFEEVFPFFNWLVAEVDFTRFKATGMTATVDAGEPLLPGFGLNPQIQELINPNTGDNLSRTETGPVLLQAMQLFLGQTNIIEWGKKEYGPGENGGISGIVYYATTRAEEDPRYAVGEPWEPGIPRVQINLYADGGPAGSPFTPIPDQVIDDLNGDGIVTPADVDNYPFNWRPDPDDPGKILVKGPEDVDHNANNIFDPGDAIQITSTDSWDDNLPTGCPGDPSDPFYDMNHDGIADCYDGLRNFNQVRPGVFDGGYAFTSFVPGGMVSGAAPVEMLPTSVYIVEVTLPSGYELAKEEDKNVDFGDDYVPSPLLLPPVCVGDAHTVPAELTLFPGVASAYAGQSRVLCNRKQVQVGQGRNTAADFFLFTEVPVAAHVTGFILNDLANEFNPQTPSFGEKFAPPWLPISIRDYIGTEISRIYSDEFGAYNALLPSTFTMNRPIPSGVAPNMLTVVINDPFLPNGAQDPQYNALYSTFPYTFQYMPGTTTYLDTPVLPIAAFASPGQFPVDAEFPDGTPVVSRVDGDSFGPYVTPGETITVISMGTAVSVKNPNFGLAGEPQLITRDYGFGATEGSVFIGAADYTGNITSWGVDSITIENVTSSGQLRMVRGDNAKSSVLGIFVTAGGAAPLRVSAGQSIQAAIDAAAPDQMVLVGPGVFDELVILYKNVRLQGTGAGVTKLRAFKVPADKLETWKQKVEALRLAGSFDILAGQVAGLDLFKNEFGPGIIVLGQAPANGGPLQNGRIDGFLISGADQGGAIFVNAYTDQLLISNNRLSGNEGFYGGGIRIGHPALTFAEPDGPEIYVDAQNNRLTIRNNHIAQNGGGNGAGAGGGIALYTGTSNYQVTENFIVGNFTAGHGAGIGHLGYSNNGEIIKNTILFNQSFNQGLTVTGGGILIAGQAALGTPVGPGSGAVTVQDNRIQGNLAGAGDGGGLAIRSTNTNAIIIENNLIANNVTGVAGGAIALQDAANVTILSNTIAHNDSTATAAQAFNGGPTLSSKQPAGIVSRAHSAGLNQVLGTVNGFSAPNPFTDNIIWQNRSFHWDVNLGLVPDIGAGAAPYFWDLGVLGAAGSLNPMNGVLTSLTGPDGAVYNASNSTSNPNFPSAYFNRARGLNILPEATTGIEIAVALDEGGNFIDVAFGPLSYTGIYTSGSGGATGDIGVLAAPNAAHNPSSGSSDGASAGGGGSGCFISTVTGTLLGTLVVPVLVILGGYLFLLRSKEQEPRKESMKKNFSAGLFLTLLVFGFLLFIQPVRAEVNIQCPGDINGDAIPDPFLADGTTPNPDYDPNSECLHLTAGDGFIKMADGKFQYIFGFNNVTGIPAANVIDAGVLGANFSAPTITVAEGKKLYLTLTNVGMMARPDLFDPHTVHWHGFPNAAPIFDGVPDDSIAINMGSSLSYFYRALEPGTFIYHCHAEATEHMQMGMLGQIYVTPRQDGTVFTDPDGSGRSYTKFAYNDGDGSTGYDVAYPIQISGFDPAFHDASFSIQPLPFAMMHDKYPMLNGRGYPDTVNPNPILNDAESAGYGPNRESQKINARIQAQKGQKILLRVSSLSTVSYYTLTALGIPMKVVGRGARILRGPDGKNLYYTTNSINLGGGEAVDIILDTRNIAAGTYFLYTTNLNHLANDGEDFGGPMTEIVVTP